jgi:predicted ferric reductase
MHHALSVKQMTKLQAASMLATIPVLSITFLKKRLYEGFLRIHQSLAIVSVYGIWIHLASQPLLPRLLLYSLIGIFSSTTLLLLNLVIYRNGMLSSDLPRAEIANCNGIILIKVKLSRPVSIEAGQWVGLWMFTQSARVRSLFQSHPFIVASWSDAPQSTLSFLVEPRSGFTRKLLRHSTLPKKSCVALFSGPHGSSIPVNAYDVVLMVASGFGIAAQLPYLKKLMHEYNNRKARTRRVHLVWKLRNLGKGSEP